MTLVVKTHFDRQFARYRLGQVLGNTSEEMMAAEQFVLRRAVSDEWARSEISDVLGMIFGQESD